MSASEEHDWFYPMRLAGLCCRNCGLWHGAWGGDRCPGKLERWEDGPSGDYWKRDRTDHALTPDAQQRRPEGRRCVSSS